ncbi:putative peptide/nitrate transporter [Corchorus capsularis]|uniref:Putative peptide/nitrate transporter n=1 Tax=Corchorus capsularis TaxID=210143 RepID=A0A1R3H7X3_COCAP|nr:putative peptide/nitrate transporter [Corchorus capsularis]
MDQQKKAKEMKDFDDAEKWVNDSSYDHRGRVPLRASTGVWKASLFIIGGKPGAGAGPLQH